MWIQFFKTQKIKEAYEEVMQKNLIKNTRFFFFNLRNFYYNQVFNKTAKPKAMQQHFRYLIIKGFLSWKIHYSYKKIKFENLSKASIFLKYFILISLFIFD